VEGKDEARAKNELQINLTAKDSKGDFIRTLSLPRNI
jgi:hypothetical protein